MGQKMAGIRILGYLIVAAVCLVLFGFALPETYRVERSITIDAEPADVYPWLVDMQRWEKWGVWYQNDPNVVVSYSSVNKAIGATSSWRSEELGSGTIEIIALVHQKQVVYEVKFNDLERISTGEFSLRKTNSGTLVVWTDQGRIGNNPIDRYLVMLAEKQLSEDFELGLDNLKTLVEHTPS